MNGGPLNPEQFEYLGVAVRNTAEVTDSTGWLG
jgi:hypothetical protein